MPKTNKIAMLAIAAAASGLLAACTPYQTTAPVEQPTKDEALIKGESMEISLFETNESGQSGNATLTENENGQLVVTVNLLGAGDYPDPQPAHIHVGACPGVGAVKYPLTSLENGLSETTINNLTLADVTGVEGGLALNVHKSAAEAGVYTACGDLL
jgi:hypothetical protein